MLRQTMQAQQAQQTAGPPASAYKNTPGEIVAQPHPVPHEEQGGVLVQAAMELQGKDAAAEIQRLRYVCPM